MGTHPREESWLVFFMSFCNFFFYLALPFSVTGFQVLIKADRQDEWEGIIYKIWCTYVNLIPF